MLTIAPDRADGMDDMFGRQFISSGDLGLAGRAAAEGRAFLQKLRPGRAVNGAVHPTTTQQRSVRCVYYRVNFTSSYVALLQFYFCHFWILSNVDPPKTKKFCHAS